MATLEQQLRDKDELLEKMTALLEGANSAKGQLEDTVLLLKSTVDKYDNKVKASIEEIHKGNGYIEQLSSELQAAKAKVKLKATIIRQQEQLLCDAPAPPPPASLVIWLVPPARLLLARLLVVHSHLPVPLLDADR